MKQEKRMEFEKRIGYSFKDPELLVEKVLEDQKHQRTSDSERPHPGADRHADSEGRPCSRCGRNAADSVFAV